MSLLEWRDEFATGNPGVDHEHRVLIEMINRLHDRIGDHVGRHEIEDFLGEVHALIASHFALEEAQMREHGYVRLGEHKADHERLLGEIVEIMEEVHRSGFDSEHLGRRLADWFGAHFRTHDVLLHREI